MTTSRFSMRVAFSSAFAMTAFAANSILARFALNDRGIDPGTFTLLRLLSGASVLALIVRCTFGRARRRGRGAGSWLSAALLLSYATSFSYAYISLGAATGALVLFGVVQIIMFAVALRSGERPGFAGVSGLILAISGLIALVGPGASRPNPHGAFLMSIAGFSWALYTLRGRSGVRPVQETAGNFLRSAPLALTLWLVLMIFRGDVIIVGTKGIVLALISGAITSGLGYALWYSVLPSLTRAQSGIIQLAPAPLATIGGLIVIGEAITTKVLLASFLILSGVLIGVLGRS